MLSVRNSLFKITGLPGTLCIRLWMLANKYNLPSFGLFIKKYSKVSLGESPLLLTCETIPHYTNQGANKIP